MEAQITKAFNLVSQPQNNAIKLGEEILSNLKRKIDYPIVLLHYINSNTIGEVGKLRAAIQIKLWCKYYRDLQEYQQNTYNQIIENIKESIVIAYLNFPLKISKTLRPGIVLLAQKFFPQNWSNLFISLTQYSRQYPNCITAVLKLMQDITFKYTYSSRSDPLYEEIIKVCDQVHDYLKDLTSNILQSVLNNPNDINNVQILEILMKLFYNLNYQDLHPKYQDNLHHWMQVLKSIMKLQNTNQSIFKCKGAVLEVILLYATKYKEDVEQTIQDFCHEIWQLCAGASEDQQYDDIVFNCLKFFKSLINWRQMKPFFAQHIDKLFQNLIVPNITINQTSISLFEDQSDLYIDYYFRNTQINTRRAAAIQLMRAISRSYDAFEPFLRNQIQNFSTLQQRDIKSQCIILGLTIDGSSKGFRDVDGCTQLYVKPQIIHYCYQNIVKKSLGQVYDWLLNNKNEDVLKNFNQVHLATLIRFLFYFRLFIPKEQISFIIKFLTAIKTAHKPLRKVIYLSINGFLIMRHGDFENYKNLIPYFNSQKGKQIAVDVFRVIYQGTCQQQSLQQSLTKMFCNIVKILKESNHEFYNYQEKIIKQMLNRTVNFDFSSVQFAFQTIGFISYYLIKTNNSNRKNLQSIILDFFQNALRTKSDLLNFGMQILAIYLELQYSFNQKYKQIYYSLLQQQNWKEDNQSIMSSYLQFIISFLNKNKNNIHSDKPSMQVILSKIIQIDHIQLFYRFLQALMLNTSLSQFSNSGYMAIFVQGAQVLARSVQGKKAALIFMTKLLINYDVEVLKYINNICQGFFDQLLQASSQILRTISAQKERKYLFFSICKAIVSNCFNDTRLEGLVLNNLIANTTQRFSMKTISTYVQDSQIKEKKQSTYKKLLVFKQFQKQEVDLSINQQQLLVKTFRQIRQNRGNLLNEIDQKNRERLTRLYEKYNN